MKSADDEDRALLAWRREFPILEKCVYLISHSMGAMPRGARTRLEEYADRWEARGIEAWDDWVPFLRETADRVGSLFGAPAGTVAMHQNVSTLMGVVLSAIFHPSGRRKVVYTNLNFPSIHYNYVMHESLGLRVEMIESPDGIVIPTERMVDAIDADTLAVVVDHGIFRSGYLQDLAAIAAAARAKGAFSIVDAYQTVGCVPIEVAAWGIDFLLGGAHKWLCGGPGAAFLYVRPDLISSLRPRLTGWFSHRDPFAFDLNLEFADDAMRFATGTPNIAGLHAARAGIDIVAAIGVDRIRRRSVRLTTKLIEHAQGAGLTVRSPRESERRTGVVCLDFPGAERAEPALLRRGFQVDYRPMCGLRVSPHFYTTEDELLSIVPEIRAVRAQFGT
jgi:kynureninase